jgi:hypothetical protein
VLQAGRQTRPTQDHPRYEANWEAIVLAVLAFGGVFAFVSNFWAGVAYAWLAKEAVQALNNEGRKR